MTASSRAHQLKFPLSAVARLGDPWRAALLPLDLEELKVAAQRITGLDDFGDDASFWQRYELAVGSLLSIDWNLVGRQAVKTNVLWQLGNRLRLVHLLKHHPEVRQTSIEAPLVILGLFRTGSSFLHNVLAADPQLRAPYNWELSYPAGRKHDPLGDVTWRKAKTWSTMQIVYTMFPDQDEVHSLDVNQHEEDFFLLENDFANLKFIVGLGDFDYAWKLLGADLTSPFEWHRLQLQILGHGRPGRRWLLKCPWHLWNLKWLLETYPDAKIVQTHRDISAAIASQVSLTARMACRLQHGMTPETVGRFGLEYARAGLERGLAVRDQLPSSQVYDVYLRDLRAKPGRTLRSLYEHFDLPHDDDTIRRLVNRAAKEPKLQRGVHAYSLSDFGLSERDILKGLDFYVDRFDVA